MTMRGVPSVGALAQAGAAVALAQVLGGVAMAQQSTGQVEIRAGATVVDNPFLRDGESGAAVGGMIEIQPRLTYETAVTRVDLDALARLSEFADKYESDQTFSASARINHRADERLTLNANASIFSSRSHSTDFLIGNRFGSGNEPALPNLPTGPQLDDITTLGQRGRTTTLRLGAGLEYTLDARNRVAFDGSFTDTSFTQQGATDYAVGQIEGRYTRIIDERTSVGVIAGYQIYDYSDPTLADARSGLGMLALSHRLDANWSLTASAGVNRTKVDAVPLVPGRTITSFSARAGLCYRTDREGFCLDYSRQPQATAFSGVRTTDTASLSYDHRLSERDTVSLGGQYSRSGRDLAGPVAIPSTTLYGVRGRFDRRLNQRLGAYVEASADRLEQANLDVQPRLMVGAGISFVLGRPR